jgi:hypothetical protein
MSWQSYMTYMDSVYSQIIFLIWKYYNRANTGNKIMFFSAHSFIT